MEGGVVRDEVVRVEGILGGGRKEGFPPLCRTRFSKFAVEIRLMDGEGKGGEEGLGGRNLRVRVAVEKKSGWLLHCWLEAKVQKTK